MKRGRPSRGAFFILGKSASPGPGVEGPGRTASVTICCFSSENYKKTRKPVIFSDFPSVYYRRDRYTRQYLTSYLPSSSISIIMYPRFEPPRGREIEPGLRIRGPVG